MSGDFFEAYLRAKKSVDDRALNLRVWNALKTMLKTVSSGRNLRLLEIGGGIGTMLMRMLDDNLLPDCDYCLLDINAANVQAAPVQLSIWAAEAGLGFAETGANIFSISTPEVTIRVEIVCANIFEFIQKRDTNWDVLIGHAVLDLFDLSKAVPAMKAALNPEGILYFTINYDGHTIFEPQFNPQFEEHLLALYNQSMDERLTDGILSGDSQTGRHLFAHLKDADIEILAAGSSDWVVYSGSDGYPFEEAKFLNHLIDTINAEMKKHPLVNQDQLIIWVRERKNQIETGDLVCIVHQLDFLGKVPPQ